MSGYVSHTRPSTLYRMERWHGCNACGAVPADYTCGRCEAARYCGGECQRADWQTHVELICNPETARRFMQTIQDEPRLRDIESPDGMRAFIAMLKGDTAGGIIANDSGTARWQLSGLGEERHRRELAGRLENSYKQLAAGTYGKVYSGNVLGRPLLVIKQSRLDNAGFPVTMYNSSLVEGQMMRLLSETLLDPGHTPHLPPFIAVTAHEDRYYIVSKRALYGSIRRYINYFRTTMNTRAADAFLIKTLFEITWTLAAIHRVWPGFRHNDAALRNILADYGPPDGHTEYTGARTWRVPNDGVRSLLWDFDMACIPTQLDNDKLIYFEFRTGTRSGISSSTPVGADLFIVAAGLVERLHEYMSAPLLARMREAWPALGASVNYTEYRDVTDWDMRNMISPEEALMSFAPFGRFVAQPDAPLPRTDVYRMPALHGAPAPADTRAIQSILRYTPIPLLPPTLPVLFGGAVAPADVTPQMSRARATLSRTVYRHAKTGAWTVPNDAFAPHLASLLFDGSPTAVTDAIAARFMLYAGYTGGTFGSAALANDLLYLIGRVMLRRMPADPRKEPMLIEKLIHLTWFRTLALE